MTARYATITLNETSANLAMELLRAGLARVKPQSGGRAENEDVRELTAAEGETAPFFCNSFPVLFLFVAAPHAGFIVVTTTDS
jgi:hypothetical protein